MSKEKNSKGSAVNAPAEGEDQAPRATVSLLIDEKAGAKNYGTVRNAFAKRDAETVRTEHAKKHEEPHKGGASEYVKSIVFGGLDGIMTSFAIVASAAGSDRTFRTVLVFGFANVFADAFSMGFGEFVSGTAERDFAIGERKREEWEVEVDKEMEKKEMVELYEEKGLSHEDAVTMVDIISKDPKIFVDFMMVDELGILVDEEDQWGPLKSGAIMFSAFITFGMVPLLPYLKKVGRGADATFYTSCFITACALLLLGAVKGHLTSIPKLKAAGSMLFNGVVSGVVSYKIGTWVQDAVTAAAGADSGCGM